MGAQSYLRESTPSALHTGATARAASVATRKSNSPKPFSGSPRRFSKHFKFDKRFLLWAVSLISLWFQPSTSIARLASPMANEFTNNIVWRKDLAYVTQGNSSQTLDLYAPKKAKNVPLTVWIHGALFYLAPKRDFLLNRSRGGVLAQQRRGLRCRHEHHVGHFSQRRSGVTCHSDNSFTLLSGECDGLKNGGRGPGVREPDGCIVGPKQRR